MLRDLRISGVDDLLFHLKTGCPMSGVVGYGGLYTPGPPGASEMTEEELVRRQGDVLARSVRAIRSDSKDNRLAIWRSVQKEVAAGYMVAVRPPANAVYLRRFLIRQVKFDDEGSRIKERACDDGRMALVNKSVHMSTPVKLDTYVEVARRAAFGALESDPAATFRSVGLDHKDAYRQLRARNDRLCRCVVVENPEDGEVAYFRMERISFGGTAAVVHNAFARILARVVRRGLRLPLCQYYDDFAAPTLDNCRGCCRRASRHRLATARTRSLAGRLRRSALSHSLVGQLRAVTVRELFVGRAH
ncbi:hypothetical protein DIPPA_35291 [Diplonema papillatum]|nr:hypothetical protein DIPPA_35291 [Diplonema papillatum]